MGLRMTPTREGPPYPVPVRAVARCDTDHEQMVVAGVTLELSENARECFGRLGWKFTADGRVLCPACSGKAV